MPRLQAESAVEQRMDLTAMIDISFQLITFFVMSMTFAKEEAARRITLPIAASAALLKDERIPDSFTLNIAYLEREGEKRPVLLQWGLELDLSQPASWDRVTQQVRNEANLQKSRQGPEWKKTGLSTTVILRIDEHISYAVFVRIMDLCRGFGFNKFQLKAGDREKRA